MKRVLPLLAWLIACETPPAPAPPVAAAVLPVLHIGRGQPVEPLATLALPGAGERLQLPTVWQVPGGAARAVIYGVIGDHEAAVDLVDIDRGVRVWRDTKACAGPIVGVTTTRVVCADAKGTRSVELATGALDWETTEPFIAIDDDRVAIGGLGAVMIRAADGGDEVAHLMLPPGVLAASVIATCSAHEVFTTDQAGRLSRIVDAPPTAKTRMAIAWAVSAPLLVRLDPCGGASVIVATRQVDGLTELAAYARATGKLTGAVAGVTGSWPARDGTERLEIATATGVAIFARDLVGPGEPTGLPPLGERLAVRGDRRLVRATPLTAALVDRTGVRAYLPFGELGGALGDAALVAASWQGTASETVHRRALPSATIRRPSAIPPLPVRTALAIPAELRDLPDVIALDETAAIVHDGSARAAIAQVAIDPADPAALYALALEREVDDTTGGGVARADLAARSWRWHRADGCGNGLAVGLAIAREVIACGARTSKHAATIRATTRDGVAAWSWLGDGLDAIAGGGDLIAVFAGDRLTLLAQRDGKAIGELASDDGVAVRAAIIQRGGETWLATYEHGGIVIRVPAFSMTPRETIAIAGVVETLAPSRDGFLVTLEDGDAYRIELRGLRALAIPAIGVTFRATGELVTGDGPGGVLYAAPRPPPPAPRTRAILRAAATAPVEAAPLATPVPPPAVIGTAWQYALFALDGGLVARNDYALASPTVPLPAIARASRAPLVVMSGEAGSRTVIVLEPRTGDPLRRVRVPLGGLAFSTIVDDKPIVGIVVATPLRVIVF